MRAHILATSQLFRGTVPTCIPLSSRCRVSIEPAHARVDLSDSFYSVSTPPSTAAYPHPRKLTNRGETACMSTRVGPSWTPMLAQCRASLCTAHFDTHYACVIEPHALSVHMHAPPPLPCALARAGPRRETIAPLLASPRGRTSGKTYFANLR